MTRHACGIDIGSRSIKVVIFDGARCIAHVVAPTGARPRDNAHSALDSAIGGAGLKRADIARIAATGYGRNHFKEADLAISEIICHGRGAAHMIEDARTVIDIGGQDSKVMSLTHGGRVTDFVMNDRCAAGTGKFLEMVSLTLDTPLELMGALASEASRSCEISSMCAVFAESEIIGFVQGGTPAEEILRGVFLAVARRTLSMAGRIRVEGPVVFTGGVAMNSGMVDAIGELCGMKVVVPRLPQIAGALGAAILAMQRM